MRNCKHITHSISFFARLPLKPLVFVALRIRKWCLTGCALEASAEVVDRRKAAPFGNLRDAKAAFGKKPFGKVESSSYKILSRCLTEACEEEPS